MTKPITPNQAGYSKSKTIPDEVIAAFNECVSKYWDGTVATFTQDEVIRGILARMPNAGRGDVFDKRWLDIEGRFASAGWRVEYDKPGYNENYPATFRFKRRTR